MRRSLFAAGLAFVLVLGTGVLVGDLRAGARVQVTPPAGIAMVDIEKVFKGLAETADKDADLKAFAAQLSTSIKSLKDQVAAQRSAAEALPAGRDREDAMTKAVEMDMNEQVREKYFSVLADRKQANMYRVINERVVDGCKRLAQKNGYTMVISSDDAVKISDRANSDDAQRIMSLKRFLYVAPEHDVTNDLIAMLNAEYAALKKPATP